VIIRQATSADATPLAVLALRTFIDAFAQANRAEDMQAYTDEAFGEAQQQLELESPNIVTLLVEDAPNGFIAYAQLRRTPDDPHGEVELARFYVLQTHHGRGMAQTLMDAVFAAARNLGARQLWLGVWERNFRAIAFYSKCGFAQTGTHPFLLGSDLQTDWVMNRAL
jgi:ribosomal protein S18 acetylase RimI-like enzyme